MESLGWKKYVDKSPVSVRHPEYRKTAGEPCEASAMDELPRRVLLATAHFDVVNYTGMIRRDDLRTVEIIRGLWSLISLSIVRNRGFLPQTAGDSLLVAFLSATDAVNCAIEVQLELHALEQNLRQEQEQFLRLRVGIDVGEVIVDGDDLHGEGVITAVRLQAICAPGNVCISRTAHDFVRNRLDVQFEPMGAFKLKNIPTPVEVLQLRLNGEDRQLETEYHRFDEAETAPAD